MGAMEHLICLHEPTDTLPTRIEITVAGEEKKTVWDAAFRGKKELTNLLHNQYGGLRFLPPDAPNIKEGNHAWQDTLDALQEHRQSRITENLEKVLERMMTAWQPPEANLRESESALLNPMDAHLVRRLHELRLDMERDGNRRLETTLDELRLNVERLETKLDAVSNNVRAKIDECNTAGLGDSQSGMLRSVAFDIACLRWPVPRLACLLPAHEEPLSEVDRSHANWTARLQGCFQRDRGVGKGTFRRELRLFLLCAHDMSLVDCGPEGQGYKVNELGGGKQRWQLRWRWSSGILRSRCALDWRFLLMKSILLSEKRWEAWYRKLSKRGRASSRRK
ncbi:unnamed protein product [Sphacelaria rigidula]